VDDPILEGFELIDRDLLTRREVLSALRADVGGLNVSILDSAEFVLDPDTGLPVAQIEWSPQVREWLEQLREQLLPLTDFTEELIEKDLPNVREDIDRLAEAVPERKSATEGLEELYKTEKESICGLLNISEIDEAIFEVDQLDGLSGELVTAYAKLIERLLGSEEAKQIPEIAEALVRAREAEGNVEEPEEDLPGYQRRLASLEAAFQSLLEGNPETIDPRELALTLRDDIILASQDLVAELGDDILALQLIQARARTESVVLPEIDISPETAFEIARQNRRDWANARAVLVDAWRNIEVVADDLESTLDLTFSGDVQNFGDNPLDLRSRTGRLRVGLQWDAPITRLLERNAYRRALIQYEQARRSYYVFVDTVWQLLRDEVRQLEVNRFNFELGRQSVRIAAQQIELNADIRALNDARGRSSGPTAARDAISALSDLLQAQNGLLNIFVNYEVVRRSLDFDLGTMELTPAGLWIDPGELQPEYLMGLPGTFGGGLIGCGCYDCGFQCHPIPVEPRFDDLLESLPEPAVQNPVDVIDEAYNEATMPVDPGPIDAIPSPEDTVDEIPSPSDAPPAPQLELPADDSLPALEPLPPPQLTPPAEDE